MVLVCFCCLVDSSESRTGARALSLGAALCVNPFAPDLSPRITLSYTMPVVYEFFEVELGADADFFGWKPDRTVNRIVCDSGDVHCAPYPARYVEDEWSFTVRAFLGPRVRLRRFHFGAGAQIILGGGRRRVWEIETTNMGDTVWAESPTTYGGVEVELDELLYACFGLHWNRTSLDLCVEPHSFGLRAVFDVLCRPYRKWKLRCSPQHPSAVSTSRVDGSRIPAGCPVCGRLYTFSPPKPLSDTHKTLDLRGNWHCQVTQCPSCGFVNVPVTTNDNALEELRPFLHSEAYERIRESGSPYYCLARMLEYLGATDSALAWTYLHAAWDAGGRDTTQYARYASYAVEHFETLAARPLETCGDISTLRPAVIARYLTAALRRRLGDFAEAKRHLRSLPSDLCKHEQWLKTLADYQELLVEREDAAPHRRCEADLYGDTPPRECSVTLKNGRSAAGYLVGLSDRAVVYRKSVCGEPIEVSREHVGLVLSKRDTLVDWR